MFVKVNIPKESVGHDGLFAVYDTVSCRFLSDDFGDQAWDRPEDFYVSKNHSSAERLRLIGIKNRIMELI